MKFEGGRLEFGYLEIAPSVMADQLLCALPLEASRGDSDKDKTFTSGDFVVSGLINGDLYDSMSFLLWKGRDIDALEWGRLLISKLLLGVARKNCV